MEILSLDLYLSTFNPVILSCAVFSIYVDIHQQLNFHKTNLASKVKDVIR